MLVYKEKPNSEKEIKKILNPIVERWFFSRFKSFSLPQLYGVMEIHSRNNVLISAPTGATKTLTAFLSILNELVDSSQKGILEDKIYCVYISPLKALNYDIEVNLKTPLKEMEELLGKRLGIRIAVRTGDTSQSERQKMLRKPPHILITTPESLALMLSSPKFFENFKNVEWCIVDEIHSLAENKRGVHLSLSLERLQYLSPPMARIGLSATISPIEEIAKFLVGYKNKELRNCKIVDVNFLKKMDLKVLSPLPDLINTTHEELHDKLYSLIDDLIQKHRTTLIFTNTRSATERVVHYLKEKFPSKYIGNIGAHHGSLSKHYRRSIEERLRKGKLKVVVCSTSLELGIDIGYIDLVICLGSPKSVARALQRIGRSGHRLTSVTKGRIIVLDRDDLVECAVLLKSAIEKKIDKIHIPKNCLDVLAQQIYGLALQQVWNEDELFKLVKQSYCFKDLSYEDFNNILDYLSGAYALEDRNIYAKIWRKNNMIGKRGKLSRVIYMTNIGVIPDEVAVKVKIKEQVIGTIEEAFLERLRPGDIFVLAGEVYKFKYASGMVAYVEPSPQRPPTVPSWFSEMLPLSFDLALEISKFRRLIDDMLTKKKSRKEIIGFIHDYLYVDENSANAIYKYFYEQFNFSEIPSDRKIVIEHYKDEYGNKFIFHTLFGRRVNDCLSRAIGFAIARTQHRDIEVGINDNGFYIACDKSVNILKALKLIKAKDLRKILELAVDKAEVLKRRFRHCATRALMILKTYKGKTKRVGRQQVSSMILLSAVKRISKDFPILKEARREVLEDLMDIKNAEKIISLIEKGKIRIKLLEVSMPSPFAFNIALQGYLDILKIEDKIEFLKRMHNYVLAKIGKNKIKG